MPIDPRGKFTKVARLRAKSSPDRQRVAIERLREKIVPRAELTELMWAAYLEALNTDSDRSHNGLRLYPVELLALYKQAGPLPISAEAREVESRAIRAHALRWRIRELDVRGSLTAARIEESLLPSFAGPRLVVSLMVCSEEALRDLVLVPPHYQDPESLRDGLARRRVRETKGWTPRQIAIEESLDGKAVTEIAVRDSLKRWAEVLEPEVS